MPLPMAGPMMGAGPMGAAPRLASPETTMPGPGGPESRTLLASPIADRLGGAIMQMQQMEKLRKAAIAIRGQMQMLARQLQDIDPAGAAELEKSAAGLLKRFPANKAPANAAGVQELASTLPQSRGTVPQVPPPAIGGPLSGLPQTA